MKTFSMENGTLNSAIPLTEQMKITIEAHQHLTVEDFSQGSEFLDDAIRTHDQPLAIAGANEGQ